MNKLVSSSHVSFEWNDLGVNCDFSEALEKQRNIRSDILAKSRNDRKEVHIITCTHLPVITLGYRSNPKRELKISLPELTERGVKFVQCERGGMATFHGPGSLMLYPVLHLPSWYLGVHQYVQLLEECTIFLLKEWGLQSTRRSVKEPGIWVGPKKIASIGIHIRAGVAIQGICLNVGGDLSPFSWIDPCGQSGMQMTSMEQELQKKADLAVLAKRWVEIFWQKLQSASY